MYQYPYYLMHYGVPGMKWGVRKYVDRKGKLTSEGRRHVSNYKKKKSLSKKVDSESNKLIRSSTKLKRDFGTGSDDPDYVEMVARSYGLDVSNLAMANKEYHSFASQNRDSIRIGRKIVKKYGSKVL